jgi:sporulation protein YlmC with PRC-barrel domain
MSSAMRFLQFGALGVAVGLAGPCALAQTAQTMTPSTTQIEQHVSAPISSLSAASFIARQESGEIRSANLVGVVVKNKAGETVGDIVDVVLKPNGQASAVILGVGGMLGLGEKNVAVPFDAVAIATDKDGKRSATVDAQKAALEAAPAYVSERTTFEKVQDGVAKLATSAKEKAIELKDQMSKPETTQTPATRPGQ